MKNVTTLTVINKKVLDQSVDILVVGAAKNSSGDVVILDSGILPKAFVADLQKSARALGISTKAESLTRLSTAGLKSKVDALGIVGLGDENADLAPETLRRIAGSVSRQLSGLSSVILALPHSEADDAAVIAEGALLGNYVFNHHRGKAEADLPEPVAEIQVYSDAVTSAAFKKIAARAQAIASNVHAARDLVNTSPNELFPEEFAKRAKAVAKQAGLKVQVWDEKALASEGFGGLVAVGQGSVRPPRLVKLTYKPAKAKKHVALVGKGITFDTGGISLKPAAGMEAMKSDMSGAAATLQAIATVAELKLPVAVTAWLALAENMPSGTAQRPSDVITIYGGKTVEVLNTDAEGRLVLADALVAAGEEHPDLIIDIATLTGAQLVALGSRISAAMGTEEARDNLVDASKAVGEEFWPMPLPQDMVPSLKSKVADVANIGDRMGGMLTAGLFLQKFVGDTPWVHLDIAGPAFNEKAAYGYTHEGGTGVGLRTMVEVIETM